MKHTFTSVLLSFIISSFSLSYAQSIDHWENLVLASDNWKYIEPGAAIPGWADPAFDDSGWNNGFGGLGYGDGDDSTTIPATISLYMRRTFSISDTAKILQAVFNADYDDGFVAYLNGVEIARSNLGLSGSVVAFDQSADGIREALVYAGGAHEYYVIDKATLRALLQNGTNVLAIEVHNESIASSDLSALFYLNAGITDASVTYKPIPFWFVAPIELVFTDSNLPIVILDTRGQDILDDPRIVIDMGIIDNGPGARNYLTDPFNNYMGEINIELRGSSSAGFPKQSYSLETQDTNDLALNVSLLGMPPESDWVLYPPFTDKTFLNNFLSYELSREMGQWAPRCRFVEVVVNGDYRGVYILMEKIKRDVNRVNIAKLSPADTIGDALTGGYILKIDKLTGGGDYFTSNFAPYIGAWQTIDFQFHDPKFPELQNQQVNYIKSFMNDFESALDGPTFADPTTGYANFMNTDDFIDFFISNEIAKNVDGYRLSTYFYKAKDSDGGKLHMGPLWDFNIAWGNADYCEGGLTTGWAYQFNMVCGGDGWQIPFWWEKLMSDSNFQNKLKCRWTELRSSSLNTLYLMKMIDSMTVMLDEAQVRNYLRWPILGTYVWPNAFVGVSYSDEVGNFKAWIDARLTWLDANIPGYCLPSAGIEELNEFSFFCFPNPANTLIYLKADSKYMNTPVLLRDLTGKIVFNTNFSSDLSIETRNLAAGFYNLSLGGEARKIIVSH